MLVLGWLAAIVSGWFLCLAAPRFDTRLHGRVGFALGAVFFVAGVSALTHAGLGLAEAIACVLALVMLAVPCVSWWHAPKKKTRAGA
ncbi:hypothetical protein G7047_00430 [Diaphorobacter sp. HDW4A]|uniref:hypothetical protein n=1 Tax=Diaphorobacter sp. HDW4A TaxID=2714924 RepID=UPI00140CE5C7|nr:hypothetical protein [Diaphorobacter sp. HDW4A]QIL78554.1 hypothetical protein G7047_00430 [Diaphorobacter sp. HDW4A]